MVNGWLGLPRKKDWTFECAAMTKFEGTNEKPLGHVLWQRIGFFCPPWLSPPLKLWEFPSSGWASKVFAVCFSCDAARVRHVGSPPRGCYVINKVVRSCRRQIAYDIYTAGSNGRDI